MNETSEKTLLLESIQEILIHKDENVTISLLLTVVAVLTIVLFLFVPKIYLANNIYTNSVDIEKLNYEYYSLKDENIILKNKIAKLRYKNGVSH